MCEHFFHSKIVQAFLFIYFAVGVTYYLNVMQKTAMIGERDEQKGGEEI